MLPTQEGPGGQKQHRRADQADQSHDGIIVEDDAQSHKHREELDDHIGQEGHGTACDVADVAGKAAQQVAGGKPPDCHPVAVDQPVEGQLLDLLMHGGAKPCGIPGGPALEQDAQRRTQDHQHHHGQQPVHVQGDDAGDEVFGDDGGGEVQGAGQQAEKGQAHHPQPVAAGEGHDPFPVAPDLFQILPPEQVPQALADARGGCSFVGHGASFEKTARNHKKAVGERPRVCYNI